MELEKETRRAVINYAVMTDEELQSLTLRVVAENLVRMQSRNGTTVGIDDPIAATHVGLCQIYSEMSAGLTGPGVPASMKRTAAAPTQLVAAPGLAQELAAAFAALPAPQVTVNIPESAFLSHSEVAFERDRSGRIVGAVIDGREEPA